MPSNIKFTNTQNTWTKGTIIQLDRKADRVRLNFYSIQRCMDSVLHSGAYKNKQIYLSKHGHFQSVQIHLL